MVNLDTPLDGLTRAPGSLRPGGFEGRSAGLDGSNPPDHVSPSDAMVAMMQAANDYKANLKSLETSNEMQKSLAEYHRVKITRLFAGVLLGSCAGRGADSFCPSAQLSMVTFYDGKPQLKSRPRWSAINSSPPRMGHAPRGRSLPIRSAATISSARTKRPARRLPGSSPRNSRGASWITGSPPSRPSCFPFARSTAVNAVVAEFRSLLSVLENGHERPR
jgi:hypothetical protein